MEDDLPKYVTHGWSGEEDTDSLFSEEYLGEVNSTD